MTATDINELHFEYRIALCNAFHFFLIFFHYYLIYIFFNYCKSRHMNARPFRALRVVATVKKTIYST